MPFFFWHIIRKADFKGITEQVSLSDRQISTFLNYRAMNESNEKPQIHFVRISGTIAAGKKKEFEQTVRFVFNQLPLACSDRNLAIDCQNEAAYSVYTEWLNEPALKKFMGSDEFQLIRGAYLALGKPGKTVCGSAQEIKSLPLQLNV